MNKIDPGMLYHLLRDWTSDALESMGPEETIAAMLNEIYDIESIVAREEPIESNNHFRPQAGYH